MAKIKVFAEFEAVVVMDLDGVDAETPAHEVEQHRPDVRAMLEDRLRRGFGDGNPRRIEYFEFDVDRD